MVCLLLADPRELATNDRKIHSRPYVSNADNPYSESQVQDDEALYCEPPQFPSRFGSAEDGRLLACCGFFAGLADQKKTVNFWGSPEST